MKHNETGRTNRVTIKTEVKLEDPSGDSSSQIDATVPTSRRIRRKVKPADTADDVTAPNTNRRSPRVKKTKLESSGVKVEASLTERVKPSKKSRVKSEGVAKQQQKRVKVEEELHGKKSPVLMQRGGLIIEVMDALYPKPPIPINHMVSCAFSSGSAFRHPC